MIGSIQMKQANQITLHLMQIIINYLQFILKL